MKKIFFPLFFVLGFSCIAEETAKSIADAAVAKKNPTQAIAYIKEKLPTVTQGAEERSLYAFLGSLQEATSNFAEAQRSYAKAASIAAGDANGMQKKSSERLVLDAVRCALSTGDWQNAQQYLNSSVRNSKSQEIQAVIKLYEQWALLSKAETPEELTEPIAFLKVYADLPTMKSVKNSVLLTLWYLTAEDSYAKKLKEEFPSSLETAIVKGTVQIYPAPFWYFVPRKTAATPSILEPEQTSQENTKNTEKNSTNTETLQKTKTEEQTEKPKKQQLGLFREKANAQNFADRAKEKGFNAYIQEEKRTSGTIYYIVVVDENKTGTMAELLKNAGFESYPLF